MSRAQAFWRSAIGKKVVMAVTGIIGIGFVIGHLAGNLLVYRGAAALNGYSRFLHSTGELLWIVRIVLIAALILHVLAAYSLTRLNNASRPRAYARREPQFSTLASRTMRWGGVLVLIFIILHILHFTTRTLRPAGTFAEGDVFANVVNSFHIWWVVLFYLVATIFLGLHLYHGAWSSVRTLGVTGESPYPLHRRAAAAIAALVWLGFTLVPLGVFLGWAGR
ncbi:MAG: succinate dehydrogenase cytochrome b subunit [Gemmatimonadaceae bacterium]